MKGVKILYDKENTEISKGVFTAVKNGQMSSQQLTAETITHNKSKKQ